MKQELPIAVILLAVGAFLWFGAGTSVEATQRPVTSSQTSAVEISHPASPPPVLSRDATPIIESDADSVSETAVPFGRMFPADTFLAIGKPPRDLVTQQKLHGLAQSLSRSPAFAARTQMQCEFFGISMSARGKYFQTDAAEKVRMETIFDSTVQPRTVLQIFDSQFVYTLRSDATSQRLEFIDLARLNNQEAFLTPATLPKSWVVGGGIGRTISHYADAFWMTQVADSENDSTNERVVFRGLWDADALIASAYSHLPPGRRPSAVIWADLPKQIPHAIELTFVRRGDGSLQPSMISFFQFQSHQETPVAKEMMQIRVEPFQRKPELPEELFALESTDYEAIDMTWVYNEKLGHLSVGTPKVAQSEAYSVTPAGDPIDKPSVSPQRQQR